MGNYILRRALAAVPALVVVATIVFVLLRLIPGDPAAVMLGLEASPDDIARLRGALGLEEPIHVQLIRWYTRLFRGDFGDSVFAQIPVTLAVRSHLEPTVLLTVLASIFSVGLGLPLGLVAATRAGSWVDQVCMVIALAGISVPGFWLGLSLILVFAVGLGWLPSGGYVPVLEDPLGTLEYLVLPAVSLGFMQAAWLARTARAVVLDVMAEDYVRTAHAKGLESRIVITRHVLKNAMLPIITVIGLGFAIMLGGSIITETVFNIPGLGRLIISSVLRRDYPVVQGGIFFIAAAYLTINMVVDVAYGLFDPRIVYK